MKKEFKLLCMLLMAAIIFAAGCKKDDDTLPAINVGFKYAPENPIAGQEITFTNASNGGTEYLWDFGDGETSTEQNPVHTYTTSGDYSVTLKVDNRDDAMTTKTVTVQDQVPTITADVDDAQMQIGVPITFTGAIYNPGGATVTYEWTFPDGKVLGDNVVTGESVTVTFIEANEDPGFQVQLEATVDKAYTATKTVLIKNQLAKTVFYAVKGGNLMMKKIYAQGEAQVADMGLSAGAHPMTLDFANDRLYIFDAGDYITYTTELETNAGSITSMSFDGTDYKTHITFSVEQAYDDAYFGCVTADKIYFTDRRNDVTAIDVTAENVEWIVTSGDANPASVPALVANNELGYYSAYRADGGPTYGWGAVNGGFQVYNGLYWWAKNSNHKGLWRFDDADIGVTGTVPAEDGILTDYAVRAFAIDEVNQKVYFSSNNGLERGLFVADIDGANITLIDDAPYDGEGGEAEPTFITGIDIDNESGYVYWAYRGPALDGEGNPIDYEANPTWKSGIKRYKLDGSGDVEYFVEDVDAYGLTIDHTKR